MRVSGSLAIARGRRATGVERPDVEGAGRVKAGCREGAGCSGLQTERRDCGNPGVKRRELRAGAGS